MKSPSPEIWVVATPSRWMTEGPVQRGTNRLIASVDSGATSMSTGSDSAAAPGANRDPAQAAEGERVVGRGVDRPDGRV